MRVRRHAILVASAAMLTCAQTETVVPEWTIRIVNSDGVPIVGAPVLERWRHFGVESAGHTELRATGPDGRVVFPRRSIRITPLGRCTGRAASVARSSHEASFGPMGQILVGIKGNMKGCELLVLDPKEPTESPLTSSCIVTGNYEYQQL
jgi:hypothetical protein